MPLASKKAHKLVGQHFRQSPEPIDVPIFPLSRIVRESHFPDRRHVFSLLPAIHLVQFSPIHRPLCERKFLYELFQRKLFIWGTRSHLKLVSRLRLHSIMVGVDPAMEVVDQLLASMTTMQSTHSKELELDAPDGQHRHVLQKIE